MIGQLRFSTQGWRRAEPGRLYGLPVLRAELSPDGLFVSRRVRWAGQGLRRGGALRVLVPEGFDRWPVLEGVGLRPVEPEPLLRGLSAPLALEQLAHKGISPDSATVALRGSRVDRDMVRAAVELCPRVRRLVVDAPKGGEELAHWLRWEFGVPILPGDERGQASLRFHRDSRAGEEDALALFGTRPDLNGLAVTAPGLEGEDQRDLPLLAALWEGGLLRREDIKIT